MAKRKSARRKIKPAADGDVRPLEVNTAELLDMVEKDRPWTPPEKGKWHKITHPKKCAMLSAYTVRGTVGRAAEDARVARRTHYNWLESDADYAEAFAEARKVACDVLETEARRRAIDGVLVPVYWQGELIGWRREYSDTLLIFLMKGTDPDKWHDRSHVTYGGQMFLGFPDLTPDEIGGGRDVAAAAQTRLKKRRRKRKAN